MRDKHMNEMENSMIQQSVVSFGHYYIKDVL